MSGSNQIRVDVLGVSVDESTTWTDTGPAPGRNVLNPLSNGERIVTRILNAFDLADANTKNAADAFDSRFSTVIGAESSTDQAAFQAIGANLIQAVRALQLGGGGGGINVWFGTTEPADKAAYPFWFDTAEGRLYLWYVNTDSAQWVGISQPGGGGGGIDIYRGTSAPPDGNAQPLWWHTGQAQLYVWTGAQFVVATNQPNLSGPGPAGPPGPPGAGLAPGNVMGQVLMWTGTQWAPASLPSAPTNPTIMAVGISVSTFGVPTSATTPIGTLTATIVPPASWTGSFALSGSGADNGSFTITGASPTQTLNAASGLTQARQYNLTVSAIQAGLEQSGQTFPLTVTGQSGGLVVNPNYGTDERFTGEYWTDGKPIYQKVVPSTGALNGAGTVNFAHGISGLGELVAVDGIGLRSGGNRIRIGDTASHVAVNATNISVSCNAYGDPALNYSDVTSSHYILRYTKSADASGQGSGWSGAEQPTGRYWTDGRPIYRRMVTRTGSIPDTETAGQETHWPHGIIGIHHVIDVSTVAVMPAASATMPSAYSWNWVNNWASNAQEMQLLAWTQFTGTTAQRFVVEYTKNESGSGTPVITTEVDTGLRWQVGGVDLPVYRKSFVAPHPGNASSSVALNLASALGTVISFSGVTHNVGTYPNGGPMPNSGNIAAVSATNLELRGTYASPDPLIYHLLYTRA